MNRQEFMERLENLLQNIPEQERVEALQYYNDYFEDAGEENEQAVLDALGTPAQVAENIKRDLNQNRYAYGEEPEKVNLDKEIIKYQPGTEESRQSEPVEKKQGLSTGIIVLIVILCILASPLLIGIFVSTIGVLVGICGIWLAIVVTLGALAFALTIVGIVLSAIGIWAIVQSPLVGIGILGYGLVALAIGIASAMLTVLIVGKLTPVIFKGIGWIFGKLTGKNKAV